MGIRDKEEKTMILFRADGNKYIGSGHVMRCLSIADYAKSTEENCVFLMASADLKEVVGNHGHQAIVYDTDYKSMMDDIILTRKWVEEYRPEILFVDSYFVSEEYLRTLKQVCEGVGTKLVYIDDLLKFSYPCDVLLNYNIYALDRKDEYRKIYRESDVPKMLLGPSYAPLRSEFRVTGDRKVKRNAENILVSTGGADSEHVALKLAKRIVCYRDNLKGLQFHFVLGAMNEDADIIRTLAKVSPLLVVHSNVRMMSKLMRKCDLAVSAAGSTLYELCVTQTPTITYILANNQIPGAEGFERHGIMRCVGDWRTLGADCLTELLIKESVALAHNYEERRRIAVRQRSVVDGRGVARILKGA